MAPGVPACTAGCASVSRGDHPFDGKNGFSKDRVRAVIEAGQQAHYTFPEPVTLYVTYRTVTANADGVPVFRDDVYGRDRRVARAMQKP